MKTVISLTYAIIALIQLFPSHETHATFSEQKTSSSSSTAEAQEEIAARFARVFYQALGDAPRHDYITNFDFDGDWRGDNNWNNSVKKELLLKAFIYYSVAETATHFFVHYAVFHPRDYKGGDRKGAILSELIREGVKRGGKYDPSGLADEAILAHENDMEGCLIVIRKIGNNLNEARVVFVETLHHNSFSRYSLSESAKEFAPAKLEDQHALLYIEPKGHGIEAFTGDEEQAGKKNFLRYVFTGKATTPSESSTCSDVVTTPCRNSVGYDLIPISKTLWTRARGAPNITYGETCDYDSLSISVSLNGAPASEKKLKIGKVGCAFLGKVGGPNMARPPWGWFDKNRREQPLGRWFFDPATTIKSDFNLDKSFSTAYVRLPFWAD